VVGHPLKIFVVPKGLIRIRAIAGRTYRKNAAGWVHKAVFHPLSLTI